MQTKRKWMLAVLAAAAVLALWFWGARAKDSYRFSTGEPGYSEDYAAALETGETEGFAGEMVAQSETVKALYPGTYVCRVQYEAAGEGSRFEVIDKENNAVLAGAELDPDAYGTELTFTTTRHLPGLFVRCYAGAGGELRLVDYNLESVGPLFTDAYWLLALILLAGAGAWLCWRRRGRGNARPLQLYAAAALASLPFLTDHMPAAHDMDFHLSRIYGLGLALLDGQFPVRINLDFWGGAGYLTPVLYPELFLYPAGIMCAAGASVLLAYKALCVAITFATAFVAYYSMRQLLGDKAGLLFAVLYLANPYRLNEFFIRGALGEGLAMIFMPLAAVGIWQLMQGDYRRGFWTAVLGITGVLQSHVISVFLVGVFGAVYAAAVLLLDGRRFFADRRRPATLAAAAAATVLLNLWFLLPFLHFSRWDLNIYHDPGKLGTAWVYLPQAFIDSFSPGGELHTTATQGDMSLSVGLALLLGVLLFVCLLAQPGALGVRQRRTGLALLALGTLALWMSSNLFPWTQVASLPVVGALFAKIQFAWRMLTVVCVCYTGVTALALEALWEQRRQAPVGVVLAAAAFSALTAASGYLAVSDTELWDNASAWQHDMIYGGQYMLTGFAEEEATAQRDLGVTALTEGAVTGYRKEGTHIDFTFEGGSPDQDAYFQLPLYAYTSLYRAELAETGEALPLTMSEYQLLTVAVPAGIESGTVRVAYREPTRFKLGNAVTVLTAAGLAALRLRRRRKKEVA